MAVFKISIGENFWIWFSVLSIGSINNSSHICNINSSLSSGPINILSIPTNKLSGLGDFKIFILSNICISLFGLLIPSIKILSTIWFFISCFSFSFAGINKVSFSSIIFFDLGARVFNISILSTTWISFSGISSPSMAKTSITCCNKGSFSSEEMNNLTFSSIMFLNFGDFNISILTIFWIALSCLIFPSIKILSTNWFFKDSFCLGAINILSFNSITFSGLGVFNISILSTTCIRLSCLRFPSIKILSIISFFNGSFCFGRIKNSSFCSIIFSGLGALKISILSTNCIKLTMLFLFGKIIKSSTNCFCKDSFSLGAINILSFNSMIFSGLGVFNIFNLSTFCIRLSCLGLPSIKMLSTVLFIKGSFSIGSKNMLSFSSIIFLGKGFGTFNISILSTTCISLSFLGISSIIILSTICFFKGSFSIGDNSILFICWIKFNCLFFCLNFLWVFIISKFSHSSMRISSLSFPSINNSSTIWKYNSGFPLALINNSCIHSIVLGFFAFLNIVIKEVCSILLLGLSSPSTYIESICWYNKGFFSLLFKISIPSKFSTIKSLWIGDIFIFSIYNESTNCFFKGSFSIGKISRFSLESITFRDRGVLNIDNLSVFWILFSGFNEIIFSTYKLSTICFCKGSLSSDDIWILSIISIIFFCFSTLNIDNFSVFCIILFGFKYLIFSIYKSSTNCFCKGSLSLGNISIYSLDSTIFFGLCVLNIVNLSTFWIIFSGSINGNPSIFKESINWPFNCSLSLEKISILSFGSITFNGLCFLKIQNLLIFWILFSDFCEINLSIYKSSTNCFCNGSFSSDWISIISLVSIIFRGLGLLNIINLSTFCIIFSIFVGTNPSIYKESTIWPFNGSFGTGNNSILSFFSGILYILGILKIAILSIFCIVFSGFS